MIRLAEDTISQLELNNLANWITQTDRLTKGPKVLEFEESFANYVGTKHCVMVNSGSSANLLMAYALLQADYLKNNKVVVPAVSWITTLSPFLQFGFEVSLCDCDKIDLGLDIEHLEQLFIKEKPAALILVHVLAHLNKMEKIKALCEKYHVLLLEDACEALGSSNQLGEKAGSLGLAGSFSFYYGHHISTIEGGAVTTNDTHLYNIMLSIRSHGWSRDVDSLYRDKWKKKYEIDSVREFYTFYYPGFNLRSTDLNAFLGLSQLEGMDKLVHQRASNFKLYSELLEKNYWCQKSETETLSSFAYGTLIKNREEVFNHFKKVGIEIRPLICGSMGRQPFWIDLYGKTSLKNADIVHDYGVYLPNHGNLTEDQIHFVCNEFKKIALPVYFS